MNVLPSTFLILSTSFSSPSCSFSSGVTSKIVVFSLRLHGCVVGSCCVKTGSAFPAFCTPLSTTHLSRALMYPERKTTAQMYHDRDTFDFCQRQESTNGSPGLVVEMVTPLQDYKFLNKFWIKSRNITMDVVNVRCCRNNRNKAYHALLNNLWVHMLGTEKAHFITR